MVAAYLDQHAPISALRSGSSYSCGVPYHSNLLLVADLTRVGHCPSLTLHLCGFCVWNRNLEYRLGSRSTGCVFKYNNCLSWKEHYHTLVRRQVSSAQLHLFLSTRVIPFVYFVNVVVFGSRLCFPALTYISCDQDKQFNRVLKYGQSAVWLSFALAGVLTTFSGPRYLCMFSSLSVCMPL